MFAGIENVLVIFLLASMFRKVLSTTTQYNGLIQVDFEGNDTTVKSTIPPLRWQITPDSPITMTAGENATVWFNYSGIFDDELFLVVESRDPTVAKFIDNSTVLMFPLVQIVEDNVRIDMEAVQIGITALEIKVVLSHATNRIGTEVSVPLNPYAVKVLRKYNPLSLGYNYILLPLIILNNIAFGAKTNLKSIIRQLRHPLHVIVGAVCQFIVMPLICFGLAMLFHLDAYTAVGVLTVGCVPGDRLSMMLTSVVGADLELSITMTLVFTLLAIGLTPLNMYIYSRPFVNRTDLPINIQIPFLEMFLQVLVLILPITFGYFMAWKFEKVKSVLIKLVKGLSVIVMICTIILQILTNRYVFASPPRLILTAFLVPFLGFNLAYLAARIVRLRYVPAKTIGAETGIQNNMLATSILRLSYPQPEADLLSRVSILAIMSSMVDGLIWVFTYNLRMCIKRRLKKKGGNRTDEDVQGGGQNEYESESSESEDEQFYTVSDIDDDDNNISNHTKPSRRKILRFYAEQRESNV
ncbi:hepatic sodium/bile acid cotransporter-like [Saccoglossus kowalevskii]|uniref:Solute carrier family 10 member 6-like n=1 Tax=Saccoglossus kowalevskii TaxID=10224 RepID=A0ABM0GMF1_SACKO|nr:PREDICTED: solute carrier family 10 member 6-like [Saccoglossus kowalevskii]